MVRASEYSTLKEWTSTSPIFTRFFFFSPLTFSANLIRNYLSTYVNHPAAAKYRGKSVVTTFSGSSCTFGQGSVNSGWASVLNGPGYSRGQIWFVPAFHVDPQSLPSFDIDAECNWGSAWPDKDKPEIETSRDEWFMQQLNRAGKGYMGTVSPVFATHLPYKVGSAV